MPQAATTRDAGLLYRTEEPATPSITTTRARPATTSAARYWTALAARCPFSEASTWLPVAVTVAPLGATDSASSHAPGYSTAAPAMRRRPVRDPTRPLTQLALSAPRRADEVLVTVVTDMLAPSKLDPITTRL